MKSSIRTIAAWLIGVFSLAHTAQADLAEYYIGIDNRATPFNAPAADGGAAYPDNPNHRRLTLLYQHVDHYHGIGAYRYTGPGTTPVLQDTNGNNRLPESSTLQPPLPLEPGSGVYAGKYATRHILGVEYSDLEMRSVHSLDAAIPDELVLFNSSSERWNGRFDAADIHLELVNVSSPYLKVGTPNNPDALSVGTNLRIGTGTELFSMTPVLWVDASAPAGDYWGEFRLTDESGTYGDSGRFFFDVRHVPEPTTLGLAIVFGAVTCLARRR